MVRKKTQKFDWFWLVLLLFEKGNRRKLVEPIGVAAVRKKETEGTNYSGLQFEEIKGRITFREPSSEISFFSNSK